MPSVRSVVGLGEGGSSLRESNSLIQKNLPHIVLPVFLISTTAQSLRLKEVLQIPQRPNKFVQEADDTILPWQREGWRQLSSS